MSVRGLSVLGFWGAALLGAVLTVPAAAQQQPEQLSPAQLARLLARTTLTLRVQEAPPEPDGAQVVVFSGVSLGRGLAVTFYWPQDEKPLRVTLAGGRQTQATVEVWDQYSGLCLLKLGREDVPGLTISPQQVVPGQRIYSGAASGVDPPVVSAGIVGGVNRVLTGSGLPPLLQCDLRTGDTSTGAAVIDTQGRLVGVLAVVDDHQGTNAWAWAVPASHVQRLLRARVPGKKVVLKRRRPQLGCVMQRGPQGEVLIQRVWPRGPAEKAGLRVGDQVLAADGVPVRSVYQVVSQVLRKQPGDRITLTVRRQGKQHKLTVTLGGGQVIEPARWTQALRRSPRQLRIGTVGRQVYQIQRQGAVAGEEDALPPEARLYAEQAKRFAAFIETLRTQLRKRDEQIRRQQQQIEQLQRQLEQLKQKLPK